MTLAVGAVGEPGAMLITTLPDGEDVHPEASVTVKLDAPGVRPVIVLLVPAPLIAPGLIVQVSAGSPLSTTLPVAVEQVGWVIVPTVGADGAPGAGLTVNEVAAETHVGSVVLRTVTAYVLGTSPAKVTDGW